MAAVRLLAALGRAGPAALPAGLLAGLLLPDLAAVVRPFLAPIVFAILTVTMLRAEPALVRAELARAPRLALTVAIAMAGLPAALAWALPALGVPWAVVQPIVLYALSPPLTASAFVALMLGLNYPLALVVSIAGTLATPLLLPWLAVPLIGIELAVGAGELALRLALMVGGSLLVALAARRRFGPARIAAAGDALAGGFVILMVLFALAVMDIAAVRLIAAPLEVLGLLAVVAGVNLALQALALLAKPVIGRADAVTSALLLGNRNMGVVIAVADMPAGSLIALYFALAQVPIFALPILLRPLYRRLGGLPPPDRPAG